MTVHFETAFATVPGAHHTKAGRNNQDAVHVWESGDRIVAVVCDGCGSGQHSEVGAKLGVRLITETIIQQVADLDAVPPQVLDATHRTVSTALAGLAVGLGNDLGAVVEEFFLFTVLGAIVLPRETVVFSLGDGLYVKNGDFRRLGPFPGNAPPYLGYDLLTKEQATHPSTCDRFEIVDRFPTNELHSLVLGTDGALDLPEGQIAGLWREVRFFRNPDGLRRYLSKLNEPGKKIDWERRRIVGGPVVFHDDVTLAVIKRRM